MTPPRSSLSLLSCLMGTALSGCTSLLLTLSPTPPPNPAGPHSVAEVINAHAGEVDRCFQAAMDQHLPFITPVAIWMVLANDGHVATSSALSYPLQGDAVGPCIMARLARWEFPPGEQTFVTEFVPTTPPRPR